MPRHPSAALLSLFAVLALVAGCRTVREAAPAPAPPSPPPAPPAQAEEVRPEPPPPAQAEEEWVRVTASRLNVRSAPGTDSEAVEKIGQNERLLVVSEREGWYEVRLPDGRTGWVSAEYVRTDAPCPPDRAVPRIISAPSVPLPQGHARGRVVLRARVSAEGQVLDVQVKENTTGDPAMADQAVRELREIEFAPPVRDCKPIAFVYTYTRNF
ncbi:MAG: TonB family protein [Acidobacteria bacterium]|nr:TonB family protein [Acidobacteriota bacterium]